MAIYKNREVSIIGPNPQASTPESINVQYKDGTHENVRLSEVKFTSDEKKTLTKNHPSKYDGVDTIEDEDLKAVRSGIAPPSDPAVAEQLHAQAMHEKQVKAAKEQNDRLKKEQEDKINKEIEASDSSSSYQPKVAENTNVNTLPTKVQDNHTNNFTTGKN